MTFSCPQATLKIKYSIDGFQLSFKSLKKLFEDPTLVVSSSISDTLLKSFKKNFQVKDTGSLVQNSQSKSAKIDISTVGDMQLDKKVGLKFNFTSTGISEIQKLSNIVFLDSPIYMKIRKALEPFGVAVEVAFILLIGQLGKSAVTGSASGR